MKILIVTDNLMRGGKERRLIELLKFFEKVEKIHITLIIFKDLIEYPEIHEFKKTSFLVYKRESKKDFSVFVKIYNYCRDYKPDVIHSWGSMPSVYVMPVVMLLRVPLINAMITHAKARYFSKDWTRAKLTFPFSKKIVANSFAGLKAYGVSLKRGRVIYNGFDFQRLDNLPSISEVRSNYNISTKFVVGMVAGFFERKDYETYLEGARLLLEKRNDITFYAIGDGKDLKFFKKKYEKNTNIIFTGNVRGVEQLMNTFDVGVLLTNPKVHGEGISNAILEMMALEKPVIATNGGGTIEIISEKNLGVLIQPLSVSQFVESLEALLKNAEMRKEIGQNAKQRVTDVFSIKKMGLNTIELYNEISKENKISLSNL